MSDDGAGILATDAPAAEALNGNGRSAGGDGTIDGSLLGRSLREAAGSLSAQRQTPLGSEPHGRSRPDTADNPTAERGRDSADSGTRFRRYIPFHLRGGYTRGLADEYRLGHMGTPIYHSGRWPHRTFGVVVANGNCTQPPFDSLVRCSNRWSFADMMAERADKKAERQREAPSLSDQLAAIEIDSRSAYDLEEWREAA